MAWRCRETIVDPNTLIPSDRHLLEDFIFKDLLHTIPNTDKSIEFCTQRRLIANSSFCTPCNRFRYLQKSTRTSDGLLWKCTSCNSTKSIRAGSFFDNSHLSIQQILLFSYGWSRDWLLKDCNLESGGMGPNAQVDWGNFMRDICEDHIDRNPCIVGGFDVDQNGVMTPKVVEIDESLMSRAKYNRGRHPRDCWVFGGIERGSRKCFLVEVPDRTRATLEQKIEEFILPGTHIMSDGWASYGYIDEIQGGIYTHSVVIHEENFVDPDDPNVHTQNQENN